MPNSEEEFTKISEYFNTTKTDGYWFNSQRTDSAYLAPGEKESASVDKCKEFSPFHAKVYKVDCEGPREFICMKGEGIATQVK